MPYKSERLRTSANKRGDSVSISFSEITNLLYPYCGEGQNNADFVVTIIDNFMEEPTDGDATGDYNPLVNLVSRTRENYFSGQRSISRQNAARILCHTDKARFEAFVENSLSGDALLALSKSLAHKGITVSALEVPAKCADLLEKALQLCGVGSQRVSGASVINESDSVSQDTSQNRFAPLKTIAPPDEVAELEVIYISKLMDAYGEAEGIEGFSKANLQQYEYKYGEHFKRQRKDFYAAESVRQGTRETYGDTDPDQFEVLKEETYDGVIDVYEQNHLNGYIRLNAVLSQATHIRIDRCWLCRDTDWIGNSQKKGVCHILVNDGKIKRWANDE